ncbi:MAG: hypothetical protein ACNA7K_00650 [Acholeplasmataceae bacterium]
MKKFLVIYIILSVLLLGAVYLLTIFDVTQERMNVVFKNIASDTVETRSVDTFLKFQSLGYKEIETYQTDDYDIYLHQTLARREGQYINQLSVIVIPRRTVDYALSVDDEEDQTSIVLFDLDRNQTRFDSLDQVIEYDYAVSYGIFLYGLYNYAIELNQDEHLRMTLYDYHQNEIIQTTFNFAYTPIETPNDIPETYALGFSISEIDQMLDVNTYLKRPLRMNVAIYLVLDVAFGGSLYMVLKQRKERKIKSLS